MPNRIPTLKQIVEQQDTKIGLLFDIFVLCMIGLALVVFSLETLPDITPELRYYLHMLEVFISIVFTIEYILRIYVADNKWKFVFSFYGLIDLLSILPFYLTLGVDIKFLRTVRIFKFIRIFKLLRYLKAASRLYRAVSIAREEIILFFVVALMMLFFSAAGIYFFEHDRQPEVFASVFHCLWWAVATLTTVGYGDMYPITTGGRIFTFVILFIGMSVLAVPTGLLAAAMTETRALDLDIEDEIDEDFLEEE